MRISVANPVGLVRSSFLSACWRHTDREYEQVSFSDTDESCERLDSVSDPA